MIPRTGSLGLSRDMWALAQAACYADPVVGHEWTPPQEAYNRLACTDEAWDAGFDRTNDEGVKKTTVPFNPACADCRKAGRRVLRHRGLSDKQQRAAFRGLGAKWQWTTPEKKQERLDRDRDEIVIGNEGKVRTTSNERARQRRIAKRIEEADHKAKRRGEKWIPVETTS